MPAKVNDWVAVDGADILLYDVVADGGEHLARSSRAGVIPTAGGGFVILDRVERAPRQRLTGKAARQAAATTTGQRTATDQ